MKKFANWCKSILESDDMDAIITLLFVGTMASVAIIGVIMLAVAAASMLR
jgi:hypothetical protein